MLKGLIALASLADKPNGYKGGEFFLIEYGLKIPVEPGDVLIAATSQEWHCNVNRVEGTKYSIVAYYRRGLNSATKLAEWDKRHPPTEEEVEKINTRLATKS